MMLGDDAQAMGVSFLFFFLLYLFLFCLLASRPAASSIAPLVTLGGLLSSQRDMASSMVVAVALFKRSSIDAIRVSNEVLGNYRIVAIPAVCVQYQGYWYPGLVKREKGEEGRLAWKKSSYLGISQREADKGSFRRRCSCIILGYGERSPTDTNHVKRHSAQAEVSLLMTGKKRWAVFSTRYLPRGRSAAHHCH